jgi:ATP-dependent Clp protease protease subunit
MSRRNPDLSLAFLECGVDLTGRVLHLADEVSDHTIKIIRRGLYLMEQASVEKPITLWVNSPGGDHHTCLGLYDALERSPCHITAIVEGKAWSAASYLIQAADVRLITPSSTILVHDGEDSFEGAPKSFERWAKQSRIERWKTYDIYAARSGRSAKFWEKQCVNDSIFSAEESVTVGLVDRILTDGDHE